VRQSAPGLRRVTHLDMLASIGRLTRDVDADGAITFAPV
jgi:hypothetical protein